jgi:4-oxalocrotonate tautomerase
MPILNISISGPADAQLSPTIAARLSEATHVCLHKDPSVTAVVVNYVNPENWIIGGTSLADHGVKSFWLDIKVTAGTNTKSEIAAYIAAVFDTMNNLFGGVHKTSYIVVDEVPAANWGFAGTTQEHRFIDARLRNKT